ncbi:MAG: ribbon-helix-helix protein, CopG family [Myxococcales bacterium]|nr:ribbon-helix-helix protein, CopG family [Myxococcales bacterium]
MKAVQILMDDELIRGVDREAKRTRSDRSKLIRAVLEKHLAEVRRKQREEQHVRGYQKHPPDRDEAAAWEAIQTWPEE